MDSLDLISLLPFDPAFIWLGAKIIYLFGLAIYVTFAIVVVRQVKLMVATLNGALEAPVRMIAWIHLALAVMVFLLALVIL